MPELRLYDPESLKDCTKYELQQKLDMVQTSRELTREEIEKNTEILEVLINGGASCVKAKEREADMKAGEADISDIGGN